MSDQWFFHDALQGNVEYFDTEKEAHDAAKESIGDGSDGWPQEILDGAIKIGLVLYESTEGDHRDTDHPDWDFECDVEMAEVECSKIEDMENEITALKKRETKLVEALKDLIVLAPQAHDFNDKCFCRGIPPNVEWICGCGTDDKIKKCVEVLKELGVKGE